MKTKQQEIKELSNKLKYSFNWNYMLIFLLAVCLLAIFVITLSYQKPDNEEISVPKISGVYIPMDNSKTAVVVFDMNNPQEAKLVQQLDVIFKRLSNPVINRTSQGGTN